MPPSIGQSSQPEQPDRSDPHRVRQLADRLLELQSVDQSIGIDAVLEELDPSIRPLYRNSIEEYLQTVTFVPADSANLDTLAPDQTEAELKDESIIGTDRARDDATVDIPLGFKAPPRDRALPPAKRPARDRCFVGQGADHSPLPDSIGKFRIKGELGRGACGVVYLGFDEELQRNVAIKVSLVADAQIQERLRVEASKAAQIDSDGIVPVYHIGSTDAGAVYVVQKYIQGTNLRAVLDADGPVSPARAVRVIGEIALALEPAHALNILHRDLKPDNILIDENGKLWIADFGLAISEEEQQGRHGELAGTPVYMSPEQIKGRISFLDARSDLWALGVMLYELLTGKMPFNGRDRKTLTEQICELDPRPLHQRSPKYLTEELNNVFMRCCAKKAADRYASARELTQALEELIAAGLGEQNINGETITGYVGDSPIDYDTLGTRFSVNLSGRSTGSSVLLDSEGGVAAAPAGKRNAVLAGGGALLGIAGLLALSIVEYRKADRNNKFSEIIDRAATVQPAEPNADPLREQDPLHLIDADGSHEKPWVVSQSEMRSHETIQSAIDHAGDEDFILVRDGQYDEALEINKSLTITGTGMACELGNEAASPITISGADPTPTVRIENMSITGSGAFNTIELNVGTLLLKGCRVVAANSSVNTGNSNCIKAGTKSRNPLGPMNVTAINTIFDCFKGFAVSLTHHTGAEFQGCDFKQRRGSGIQLIDGPGRLYCCTFYGPKGIYLESYRDEFIPVIDCQFLGCDYGLAAFDGATALIDSGRFVDCGIGCQAVSSEQLPTPGNIAIFRTDFENCNDAVVSAGKLRVADQCVISGGGKGIGIASNGSATVSDTLIRDVNQVGVLVSGTLVAQSIDIQRSKGNGIAVIQGTINLDGGQIVGSEIEGISIVGSGHSVIKNFVFENNQTGVNVGGLRSDFEQVTVTGGDFGFVVANETEQIVPAINVSIKGAVFAGQQTRGIFASGEAVTGKATVSLSEIEGNPVVEAVEGAILTRLDET